MADLTLVYFAWVREAIGRDEERVERPAADATVATLIAALAARGGGYAEAFARPDRLRAALDQHFVPMDSPIGDAKELAIFPPVTGG
ncbi:MULTISPECIES: molybdopterin converting factor subunit 1 [Sphingobium]|uniref:Molybdopterin synthase sulfur carrier subunit n=1 Tax=Sphingobium fuliginis (strain ATCC 27551) TaxID=336203 RepID=A0ABQ1FC63_SPHSA|nr:MULTISPECIES: molybdopterin converting factor subunit 1 [Sphingobium]AJR25711.1 molybdenum cofactor biosynthesis protein MoaD [Sphingobium sp. YBL2]PNQ04638.1 molybdopterin converting factor subunit 1 [Sphingobium sp. SA916]RYL96087.1 molybdopterin converting factor subunit 1 [Sphingobium fuliginis]UXC92354.1 molybdopterin converting factor subunit 1 [Sphingobium sp. RSMS]WDA37890.1 molybdopterin converting factor subunit 1 [Sphingobium sp. YC-XJ3]